MDEQSGQTQVAHARDWRFQIGLNQASAASPLLEGEIKTDVVFCIKGKNREKKILPKKSSFKDATRNDQTEGSRTRRTGRSVRLG
jgi:hypothetical protein